MYLECDGPLSWEVWEDRLPSKEFRWQPEMVALGEMESDWKVSQTTWRPCRRRREQINPFFPSGRPSRLSYHITYIVVVFLTLKNCSIAPCTVIDHGILPSSNREWKWTWREHQCQPKHEAKYFYILDFIFPLAQSIFTSISSIYRRRVANQ